MTEPQLEAINLLAEAQDAIRRNDTEGALKAINHAWWTLKFSPALPFDPKKPITLTIPLFGIAQGKNSDE